MIEDHGDRQLTVLVPLAPASFAGPAKIAGRDRIEMLDETLGDVSRALSHWGVGVCELLGRSEKLRNYRQKAVYCDEHGADGI